MFQLRLRDMYNIMKLCVVPSESKNIQRDADADSYLWLRQLRLTWESLLAACCKCVIAVHEQYQMSCMVQCHENT